MKKPSIKFLRNLVAVGFAIIFLSLLSVASYTIASLSKTSHPKRAIAGPITLSK
jgi:hypothetical protein